MTPVIRRHALPIALASLGGLYITQSVLGGFIWSALPAVMRQQGMALDQLGFLSLLVLPWALKFLWSPWIERWRRPHSQAARTKAVIAVGGGFILFATVLLALRGDMPLPMLIAALFVIATATATVDIACDGHAVEAFPTRAYGWANMVQVGGAYIGAALGGGLVLIAIDRLGWQAGMAVLIGLCLLGTLPFLLLRQPKPLGPPAPAGASLRAALMRPDLRRGLLITALFVAAMKSCMGFFGPFLVDYGFSLTEVGLYSASGSLVVGLLGAVLGGIVVARLGTLPVLMIALIGQACVLAYCLAVAAGWGLPLQPLAILTQIGSNAWLAFGFVALYARFMQWSDPGQAGVDFTIFQCTDALIGMLLGLVGGQIAQHFGYSALFGVALVCSIICGVGILLGWETPSENRVTG
ncbi:MFS transporter [Paracoccus aestuariivivens]|uniref:MFS transporter n=1 Tax=Paracoccus aestuariivivens TaxID=1820333 RepID=A0A6L6J716_9RHOB|nr:MFS transporter [Paracoccus aestuariivivens]MTH77872.1 MFS transporter [Paracoccus aestuariivivens]